MKAHRSIYTRREKLALMGLALAYAGGNISAGIAIGSAKGIRARVDVRSLRKARELAKGGAL